MRSLHALNPIGRFDDRADDYVKYRPAYPPAAIDAILEGLGPSNSIRAADIGAGTGISARLLGDRGTTVVAVEPGAAMRRAASPHPNVRWIAGTAEATGLAEASMDLVLCAQSFHWFRAGDALAEFARVLTPGGRLCLMWNSRSRRDAFTAGYRAAIRQVDGESVAERDTFDPDVIARSGRFSPPERLTFANAQRLDFEGLVGRSESASYVPKVGDAAERLRRLLRELFERHADQDGLVTLVYETEVYRSARD